ncbi:suppressor of cytokine signaling 1-like [Bufo gargarizans]|uniref:suppressor of cytokine signaling 1-like n=1 Tax=Bufo gargarizans TaxID=30331 RepID=UPI001CF519EF|nr:suppressor of cytokine signaling 1-like [Bufo gargarizans]XP_044157461.1 suppressor of cytokine signaling 1-like [Bufo gargarizans]XP_044157463.1 suppressor of cytokine signaling 1-like [Bufo gargarizans]XP_044157464.1 suppressor of cytokine signaling 1-like [Bufo gargarizans]
MVGGGACPQEESRQVIYPVPGPPIVVPQSHYRLFRNSERKLVELSVLTLQASGFYWGPLPTAEAHSMLAKESVGTFLVRDSSQGNHLFSVSVKMESGPVSVRVLFFKGRFWLRELFSDCPVKLLEQAVERSKKSPLICQNGIKLVLSKPLRRTRILSLQQLCRLCIVTQYGREGLPSLPIQPALRNYIEEFPFKI